MQKLWQSQSESAIEQELPGGGKQQVFAAHDLGDLHRRVVHHHGQLISRNAIVPPHDKIAKVPSSDKTLRAEMAVGEGDAFGLRNAEAPGESSSGNVRGRSAPACAWVNQFILGGVRRGGGGLNVPARAGARINGAAPNEFLQCLPVKRQPGALNIRSIWPATIRPLLPLESKPAKVLDHGDGKLRPAPVGIEVLRPEEQGAVAFLSPLRGRPKSAGMAEVKVACWRRSQPP